jgi:hypothetical protein
MYFRNTDNNTVLRKILSCDDDIQKSIYLEIDTGTGQSNGNGPNGIFWGWEETDSCKKPEALSL